MRIETAVKTRLCCLSGDDHLETGCKSIRGFFAVQQGVEGFNIFVWHEGKRSRLYSYNFSVVL